MDCKCAAIAWERGLGFSLCLPSSQYIYSKEMLAAAAEDVS